MPLIIASFSGLYGYGRIFDVGSALVSTVRGSQILNGETSYMFVSNTDSFRMSTFDFTVEWFQYIQYLNSIPRIFSIGNFPSPSFSVSLSTFISSVTTDIFLPNDPIFVWPSTSSTLTPISNVIDGLSSTVYRNNTKYGSGFIVRPLAGASIVTQLAFITAGNLPECDPITFTLEGTNDAITIVPPVTTPAWVDSTLLFFLPFNGDPITPSFYTDAGPNRNNFPRLGGSLITIAGRTAYNGAGQGGNVLLLNLTVNNVTNATYSAWVYLLSTPSGARGVIFSRSNSNTGVCGINFNGSALYHHWNDNYFGQPSNVVPPLNTWTHIALVITPTASFWYQNGVLVETKTQSYSVANLSNFYIGNDNPAVAGDRNFNGYIDDPMFATRAYSSTEIASIYTNSIADHTGLPSGSSGGSASSFTTSTNLNGVNWTTIVANQPTNCSATRFSKSFSSIFENTNVYNAYRIRFPTIRDGSTATFMQIGEVEMLGSIVNNFVNVWMNSSIVMNALASTLVYDTWAHFALTRSTNSIRLFQNGFQIGSTLTSTINLTDSVNPLLIGTTFDATNIVVPILTAIQPLVISATSLTLRGSIDSTGGAAPTVRGFVWSTLPNPTILLSTLIQESGIFQSGTYSFTVSSFLPFTTYYIRAFATNASGIGYSNQIVFTTDRSAPIISSISGGTITNNSSLVIGQIVATGGFDVTIRGIAWDTNMNPTTLQSTVSEIGQFNQPGFFSSYAIGLGITSTYFIRAFGTNALGTSFGSNLTITGSLYTFTSFTFTNAGATGRAGPTLSQCRSAYSSESWTQNSQFLNMTTQGIQLWRVPLSGNYLITCAGAAGGSAPIGGFSAGRGAVMQGTFSLTQNQVIQLLVGQRGNDNSINNSGGGGGSFVVTTNGPLIVAGGGGGAANVMNGYDANSGTSGITPATTGTTPGTGGVNGNGASGASDGSGSGNNGGGYFTNGTGGGGFTGGGGTTLNGFAYVNGGLGALATGNTVGAFGGFGGGACGYCNGLASGLGPGGAGGYSGGGAGSFNSNSGGGGGGSFGGTLTSYNTGMGYVTITRLEPAVLFTLDATSITATTAVAGANVISLGSSSSLTLRGVVWSTSPAPTIALTTKVEQSGTFGLGSYTLSLTGLQGGTTYYIRAYVSGNGGLSYGDEKQFTTNISEPTLTTNSATIISGGSTTVTYTITSTGGATITTRGICWSTLPNPTISLPTKTVESGSFSTGIFTATATGISANTIYIRAYATNIVGTSYGQEITAVSIPAWVDSNLIFFLPFNGDPVSPASYTDAGPNGNNFPRLGGSLITISNRTAYNGVGQGTNVLYRTISINNITSATYSCWLYMLQVPGEYQVIMGSRGSGSVCMINFHNSLNLDHHWNNQYYGQGSNVIVPLTTWTHVAVVITPTASFWYKNGELIQTKNQSYGTANLTEFWIGTETFGPRNLPGYIDDPMFARRAYTSNEIATIYTTSVADHTGLPA